MDSNKIKTYINFAKKSRSIIYGLDDIIKSRQAKLIIVSSDLAEKSENKLNKFTLEKNISKIKLSSNEFCNILQVDAVKVFAITDINLAKAIKMNFTNAVSNGGNLE